MFEGILTALITPFRDGEIDEPALRGLVERQISAGVSGLVPCGSTGESATLSHEEHRRVIDIVIDASAGRIQVVAGTGSNSTREAIALTAHARDAGADGALLLSPYYNKPTQEGIHNQCPDSFRVLSGDDALTLPLLSVGGHGCISTTANLIPEQMVALDSAWREGNTDQALKLHQQMLPLFDVLFCETNPIPIKAAVALMGWAGDEIRLPLTPITQPNRDRLEIVLKESGVLT